MHLGCLTLTVNLAVPRSYSEADKAHLWPHLMGESREDEVKGEGPPWVCGSQWNKRNGLGMDDTEAEKKEAYEDRFPPPPPPLPPFPSLLSIRLHNELMFSAAPFLPKLTAGGGGGDPWDLLRKMYMDNLTFELYWEI